MRRVIFFARYEAAELGAPYIETEHLLLGLLLEDKALFNQVLAGGLAEGDTMREELKAAETPRGRISTSVDLPLGVASKRVLAYTSEEAERLNYREIATHHLLLGLLRETESKAARALRQHGLELEALRRKFSDGFVTGKGAAIPKQHEIIRQLRSELNQMTTLLTVDIEPATMLRLQ